jgi:hypothetical protein
VQTLLRTGVIQSGWPQEVFWAVVTQIVICIRDLVAKSERHGGKAIDFTDDVLVKGRVEDAASLIRFTRDALCHFDSPNHNFETDYVTRNVSRGKDKGYSFRDPGTGQEIASLGSDYADDIALIFGDQRIYMKRHLLRAFDEAVGNLQGFLNQDAENPS